MCSAPDVRIRASASRGSWAASGSIMPSPATVPVWWTARAASWPSTRSPLRKCTRWWISARIITIRCSSISGMPATPTASMNICTGAYQQMNSIGLDCVDGEDQDRHLIDMPHAAFAAVPPEHVADFAAKYGHLGLHWMQVGAQNADGLCYYDIVRGGMDKGVGLADLCEKMGLTLADAVAAGDSANDVAMLKAAGLGCCMSNGTPDAKAAADRIIGDVREDGLADLIDELWFDGPRAEPSGRDLGSPWDKIESAGGQ